MNFRLAVHARPEKTIEGLTKNGNLPLSGQGEAAEALELVSTGLEVAISAITHQNSRFIGLFYPMAVLLEGFSGLAQGRVPLFSRNLFLCFLLVHEVQH